MAQKHLCKDMYRNNHLHVGCTMINFLFRTPPIHILTDKLISNVGQSEIW